MTDTRTIRPVAAGDAAPGLPASRELRPSSPATASIEALQAHLNTVGPEGYRVTGAFVLAQTGLLDGRRVTTHWEDQADLARQFPALTVVPDAPWVDGGDVVTSGGISAGIDMTLHLVERLHSRRLAERTARQMEYLWNEGGVTA
ncbi:DJ-1/PfpI family protein [Deinococcus sp.]|uniref:DJ-1/PfpI family protein n=1 Tax=Deinococcus sp. TaxID=47478 RepID=UPI0028699BDC|nr:DJ-1/PfpI family protein [Deinococcus sp.]